MRNKLPCMKIDSRYFHSVFNFSFLFFYTLKLGVYGEDTRERSRTLRTGGKEFSEYIQYNRDGIKNCQYWCCSSSSLDKYSSNLFGKSGQQVLTRRWSAYKPTHSNMLCTGTRRCKFSPFRWSDIFCFKTEKQQTFRSGQSHPGKYVSCTCFSPSTKETSAGCCRDLKKKRS